MPDAHEPARPPSWPPPAPVVAFACPRCQAQAEPRAETQRCACGLRFSLRAGPLLDSSLRPPAPAESSSRIKVKSSGAFLRRFAVLEPDGLQEGTLDPVTGHIPMTDAKVAYRAVFTVAVWRRIPWGSALAFLLLALPLTALSVLATISSREAGMLVLSGPLTVLSAWIAWSVFGMRAHWARVVSPRGEVRVRFDAPFWRRRRFHDELLRRCGIAPGPIP